MIRLRLSPGLVHRARIVSLAAEDDASVQRRTVTPSLPKLVLRRFAVMAGRCACRIDASLLGWIERFAGLTLNALGRGC